MKDYRLQTTNGNRTSQEYLQDYDVARGYLMAYDNVFHTLSERIRLLPYEGNCRINIKEYILYEFRSISRLLCEVRMSSHIFKIITSKICLTPGNEAEWNEQEYVDEWNALYEKHYDELSTWRPDWFDEIENKYFSKEKQTFEALFKIMNNSSKEVTK